jgi:hypothetical protein
VKHAELLNPWGRTLEDDRRCRCPPLGRVVGAVLAKKLLGGGGWGEEKSCIIPLSMDWSSPREYTGSCNE